MCMHTLNNVLIGVYMCVPVQLQAGRDGELALQEFCVNDLEQPAFDK
jgi:hypothetical protein